MLKHLAEVTDHIFFFSFLTAITPSGYLIFNPVSGKFSPRRIPMGLKNYVLGEVI